jgi:hypothetical protein
MGPSSEAVVSESTKSRMSAQSRKTVATACYKQFLAFRKVLGKKGLAAIALAL